MKSKQKLLLVTSEFPPQPGGIGNHAWHLARSFQANQIDVQVISDQRSREGKEERDFDSAQDFEVIRIPRKKLIFLSYVDRILKSFHLAKKNDIVLLSGKFSIWIGGLLSLFLKKKYVAVLHGSEVLLPSKVQRKFTDFCLQRFDRLIAVSNYTKSLIDHLNLEVEVIPNGFEISEFANQVRTLSPDFKLNLVTVGNVTPRKGQHNIIKALPQIKKKYPQVKYHIVGIPTTKDRLISLAENLNVEEHLVFHGRVSEEEKLDLLKQATIFMMLSEHTSAGDVEGFGIAILEGNALGLPGIGARGCGIEDAIAHQKSGILVNHKDKEEIVDAIDTILGNYSQFSENAIEWTQHFTWDKIIQQYLEVVSR
ncbi:glycosyltransferase family 4 protein [Mesonia mobilis]|uniref:glycosyltransferase family 4 protein n=1 Tax=Mesonia mobilis TaxID=369791 RepID=UPI0026F28565|nr:glycosyltransferase family 4 protein [Mesonia mobilis]